MPKVVRVGDINSAGGRVTSGSPSMIIDGRKVAPIGSLVSPHKPCPKHHKHCHAKTAHGSKSFIIDGKPVTVVSNKDTCGHKRVTGSSSFIIGHN